MPTKTQQVDQKIIKARITPLPKSFLDPMPEVWITLEGSATEQRLFSYYPDEISFVPQMFIGKTIQQAAQMKYRADLSYLRS